MIEQIVHSEDELKKLVIKELLDDDASNNQHGEDEEHNEEIWNDFIQEYPIESYPVYVVAEFDFYYRGFDISLRASAKVITKKELQSILKDFD